MNKRLTIAPGFFLVAFFLGFVVTGCVNKTKVKSESAEEFEADKDKYDGPEQRLAFEIEQTRDLTTGKVPWEKLVTAIQQTETSKRSAANRTEALAWSERGPDGDFNGPSGNSRPNMDQTSGRVRAAMVDSLDPTRKTVFIGSVSGGLWKTTDITSAPSNWILVNDQMANLAIADICQDPRPGFQNIMYCCTGESYGNIDAVRGVGVFKSVDGGNSWNYLSNTSSYYRGTRILCDYLGNVYLGTRSTGLLRSSNGGANWINITPTGLNGDICDMEISSTAAAGRLHICTGIGTTQGYRFTDAPSTVTTASGWTAPTTTFVSGNARAEIAVSGNVLYALPVNSSDQVTSIYKSIDGGDNWTITGAQPSPASWVNQGWYCVTVAINPSNPDECIVGGLDCHKTTNGGISWTKISTWASTSGQYVHADQHDIQWWDGGSKLLFSSDGGEHFSSNGGITIRDRNKGLRIKQFYSVAIHPTLTNYFLAGAQDNGVHRLHHPGLDSSIEVTGGDGCYVAIDQDQGQFQFGSYVYNVYRRSTNNGVSWSTPVSLGTTGTNGRFINPWDYDNTGNKLYACYTANNYLRWNDPQTGSSTEIIPMSAFAGGNVSAVHVSPYTANRVFFGTGIGGIIKVNNSESATPTGTMINSGAGMSGYVNCVVTGSGEQNLIACISNYGAMNVWVSSNGGITWTGIDGNLPDMPVRWAMFHPDSDTKAFIATETGVWETDLINGSSTIWTANSGFPNCRTDMIKYRAADRTIAAGTHGRGIWTATIPVIPGFSFTAPTTATANCPVPASMQTTIGTTSIGGFSTLINLSATAGVPAGTSVSFSANPITPEGGSSDVTLNNTNTLAAGTYSITVTGTAGSITRSVNVNYTINPGTGPTINTHPLSQAVCEGSNVSFSVDATGTYQWQLSTNNGSTWTNIGSAVSSTYSINGVTVSLNANQYRCVLTNSCGSINSNAAVLTVTAIPPIPVITAGGPLSLCTGANVILTSSSATGNQWYKDAVIISGETNQTYTATTAGSYTVIVTASGCISPTSLQTVVSVSTAPVTPVINWNGSQLSTTAGFASYQWYLNNIAISGATTATHSPVFSGLYKVRITNAGGCSATSADFNLVATAVNNLTLNGVQYTLSPNPANDVINIKVNGNNPGKVQLRLISITGAEMIRVDNISSTATLLVSNYPAGVYYIMLSGKTEKGTFKVIINH